MIGYVTLGTKKGTAFYDKIVAEEGVGRFMESDTFIALGKPGGASLGFIGQRLYSTRSLSSRP
jgi:hypothetical protein